MITAVKTGNVQKKENILARIFGPYIMITITGSGHPTEKEKEEAKKEQELYDIVDTYIEQA